ncbi:Eukaryotic peptide chain release factor GTP-binding subunit [Ascosphaera pollenicola]|nr:Eukaryotic peptide chain release factor GTP-binding subunit [Ascosphaera pollenicola]
MQYSSSSERDEPDMEMSVGANPPIDRPDHSSRLSVHIEDYMEDHMEEPQENKSEGPPSSDLLSVPIGEATTASVSSAQEARGDTRSYISTNSTSAMLRSQTQNNPAELDRSSSQDSARPPKQYTFGGQLRFIVFSSWLNLLLFAVPVGIALNFVNVNSVAVFVVNFLAIIPLAAMLSNATEEIALRTGETIGGLLNATFGNAVELIVSLIALFKDEYVIVQTSLIGSMLSNLLLVMGMCFFFGGICRVEQNFNVTVAQTASSMLSLAVGSLIIPTAFHEWSDAGNVGIAQISRGTSILLLIVYGCYLFFQLKTHIDMYNAPSPKSEKLKWNKVNQGDVSRTIAQAGSTIAFAGGRDGVRIAEDAGGEEDEAEEPQLQTWVAILTLVISTVLVALCAEFMVGSINDLTNTGHISETFVGLILLPIVGNAAEHVTAVTVAMKDKMDLAIGVAVGSSMQIALLVLPFIVVIGWMAGKDGMNLYFDGFQIAVLFVAMLLVNYLIQDGKSHWLEGVMLMMLYMIISISAWFYPSKEKMAKRLIPVPPLSQYQFGSQ